MTSRGDDTRVVTAPEAGRRPPAKPGVRDRAVTALLACIARHGLAKTTFDDVASAAGCSRATLYRYFANRGEIVAAAIGAERVRLDAELARATAECTDLSDALTTTVVTTSRFVVDAPALVFLLDQEPASVLPWITFAHGNAFLAHAGAHLAAPLRAHLPDEVAERAGEWLARILLTYLTFAEERADLTDETHARSLIHQFVLPALESSATTPGVRP